MVDEVTVVRGWSGGRGGDRDWKGDPVVPGTVKSGGEEERRRGTMWVTCDEMKLGGTGGISYRMMLMIGGRMRGVLTMRCE
jgi:hypothetical protein